jgi:hypothetical protein
MYFICMTRFILVLKNKSVIAGADPGFQVRRGYLKKLCRAEGGTNIFGVFHVKNHDFMPKNLIFSNKSGHTYKVHVLQTTCIKS